MNYYSLKSLFGSHKKHFEMKNQSESFFISNKLDRPYIEPTFEKVEFGNEKPSVILISAVGATGKSTLARMLSYEIGVPLLDLAKHKPVGDNTLTGLLTSSFSVNDFTGVFEGIQKGTFGVIIDGIDEGRSKTNESALNAFLDDVSRLCKSASSPTVLILGRTQILEHAWIYLASNGVTTGLITISPFNLDQARNYIDRFTGGAESSHAAEYSEVRDEILSMLGNAFTENCEDQNFLAFIGYPPVLDAIVTLLTEETNYHKVRKALEGPEATDVEIALLHKISTYILWREKEQKLVPNFLAGLLEPLPENIKSTCLASVFDEREQAARLLSYSLGRPLSLSQIPEPVINAKYEEQIHEWISEHPFIAGRQFRNSVFEATALASGLSSERKEDIDLGLEYLAVHRGNYYLVYLLNQIAPNHTIPIRALQALLGAAMEFQSTGSTIELSVEGPSEETETHIEIEIEILMGASFERAKRFMFASQIDGSVVDLGSRLASAYISLPGAVRMSAGQEIELVAPVQISAQSLILSAPTLALSRLAAPDSEKEILFEAEKVDSSLTAISSAGIDFTVSVFDKSGLAYPIINFVSERQRISNDPLLIQKYLRLRKILGHFRSHSKGQLAKYKEKIENERVAGNKLGEPILQRLIGDGILSLEGPMYILNPENLDTHLGIPWPELRKGNGSKKLVEYLAAIKVP